MNECPVSDRIQMYFSVNLLKEQKALDKPLTNTAGIPATEGMQAKNPQVLRALKLKQEANLHTEQVEWSLLTGLML